MCNKDIAVSVIYTLSDETPNNKTDESLKAQDIEPDRVELIICTDDKAAGESAAQTFSHWPNVRVADSADLHHTTDLVSGKYVTFIKAGSSFDATYLSGMVSCLQKNPEYNLAMPVKKHQGDNENDVFSRVKSKQPYLTVDFNYEFNCLPHFLEGTWFASSYWTGTPLRTDIKYEVEKAFIFDVILKEMKMLYVNGLVYEFAETSEDNIVFYDGYYEAEWYYEAIDRFWVPFLESIEGNVAYLCYNSSKISCVQ